MKFGVREVANIVFRAKSNTIIGSKTFEKDEPVMYFDTAKTSALEGSSTAVYAQGGRGNPKLVTWEGEKEMTFTFEDALISPMGMAILFGAGLDESAKYFHHVRVMGISMKGEDGKISIDVSEDIDGIKESAKLIDPKLGKTPAEKNATLFVYETEHNGKEVTTKVTDFEIKDNVITGTSLKEGEYYVIDGYIEAVGSVVTISADKFADYFYIEAETLFRSEVDGRDHAAQFIIPKGKVQSNFEISMANSGDPSTFTFVVDAMADATKFDAKKKVLATINIID